MLKIVNLRKIYKDSRNSPIEVFKDFNLEIKKGDFVAIFGPNGCGKTTLLNLIAGILNSDNGSITFEGKPTNNIKIGYVFQDYKNSLFPWLKIKDNISFPIKLKGYNKQEKKQTVKRLCKDYGFNINLEFYPYQLSGGQQQFVSLLRGLIMEPALYLLDEPFSSLDYQTTILMLGKMAEIWQKTRITTLFISHEIDETIFLAQKIILLSNKPTNIIKTFLNPLPYPRKIELMNSPEFIKLKKEILEIYNQELINDNLNINQGENL